MLPLYINAAGKRIVVFGGGEVAERKIRQILETSSSGGAEVVVEVYSRDFTPQIREFAAEGKLKCFQCNLWHEDPGRYLDGAFLAIICTSDEPLNERILNAALKFNVLINYRHEGDVFMGSVINKHGFLISISTEGRGPAMARYMREKIEPLIGEREGKMLLIQSRLRSDLKATIKDEARRQEILNQVLHDPDCWAALDAPLAIAEELILRIIGDRYA